MLIQDPGTNYRLTSLQGHALEDLRCIVLDTQFVHRVTTWYYGPRKPGPPKRLQPEEQRALVWLAELHSASWRRRAAPLGFDTFLACVETSRVAGKFDVAAYARRYSAMEAVLAGWTSSPERMARQVARARNTLAHPVVPATSPMDGEQLNATFITALFEAIEIRRIIHAGRAVTDHGDRLLLLESYLETSASTSGSAPWVGVPLVIDGLFNPPNTSYVAEALVKPDDARWSDPVGTVAMASNVSYDLMMLSRIRDHFTGRASEDGPAPAALLTQDKALPRLMSLAGALQVTSTGTWDAFDLKVLTPRLTSEQRKEVTQRVLDHSVALAQSRLMSLTELRERLHQRLLVDAGGAGDATLSEALALADVAVRTDYT